MSGEIVGEIAKERKKQKTYIKASLFASLFSRAIFFFSMRGVIVMQSITKTGFLFAPLCYRPTRALGEPHVIAADQ